MLGPITVTARYPHPLPAPAHHTHPTVVARVPGNARGLSVHPDVLQYFVDVCAERIEGDDAHRPAAVRAAQRKHLVEMRSGG